MIEILAFFLLALLLGLKHSYDADHLMAVSNYLVKSGSVKSSVKIGFNWAAGHMITAAMVTVLLFVFRESLLKNLLGHFEKIAGAMLIILGLASIRGFFKFHVHMHRHGKIAHSHPHLHSGNSFGWHAHRHMFGIGIVHGLASNGELLALLTASLGVSTIGVLLIGVGVFSAGVIIGMVLFSLIFSYPLIKANNKRIQRFILLGAGSASIIYGALMLIAFV